MWFHWINVWMCVTVTRAIWFKKEKKKPYGAQVKYFGTYCFAMSESTCWVSKLPRMSVFILHAGPKHSRAKNNWKSMCQAVEQNSSTANKDILLKQNLSKKKAVFVLCDCHHHLTGAQNSEMIIAMTWQGIGFLSVRNASSENGNQPAVCQFQEITALPQ